MTGALHFEGSRVPLLLVTGATGWLGQRFVRAVTAGGDATGLSTRYQGHRVRCLVPPTEAASVLDEFGVEIVRGDLSDSDSRHRFLEGAENAGLVHFAGVVHPRMFDTDGWDRVNHRGTLALLDDTARHTP